MQRRKIRGSDIKPDAAQYYNINAEKCIAYLRGIGVDVPDEMADSWLDTQGVHRFLKSEEASKYLFYEMQCRCGELTGLSVVKSGRKAKTRTVTQDDKEYFCDECQSYINSTQILVYEVNRNGSTRDWRSAERQVLDGAFNWQDLLAS